MTKAHRALGPLLALAALAASGCGGPDFEEICQEQEDCTGGNEKDVESCIAQLEGNAEEADILGCGDELDELYDCVTDRLDCQSQPTGIACMTTADCGGDENVRCSGGQCVVKYYGQKADDDSCEAEANAYQRCD
jgi:hypothetical protein